MQINKKGDKPVMKRISAMGITLLLLLYSFACQPTPEKDIVVNKNEGYLENVIAAPPAPTMKATELTHWTESYTLSFLTVNIDADIVLPDTPQYPIFRFKKSSFDIVRINRMVDSLAAGATGMRESFLAIEEWQELWLAAKRGEYVDDGITGKWVPYEGQVEDIAFY